MATEKIIFEFDVKGADAALKEATELNKKIRGNKETIKELSKEYDKNAEKITLLTQQNKELATSQRNLAKTATAVEGSYDSLSAEMARLKKEQKQVNVMTKEGQARYEKMGKDINKLNTKLKSLDETNGVHTRNVGHYQLALKDAAGQLNIMGVNVGQVTTQFTQASRAVQATTGAIGGANKMLKLLRVAIIGTGIGALVIALASVVSYFSRTREGGETIRVLFKQIGQVVNVLIERLTIAGKGIFNIVSGNFKQGIEDLTGAFKGMGDELEREVGLIAELERRAIALEKAEILLNAQRANTKRQIKDLQLIAEDETESYATRTAALERSIKMQQELSKLEIKIQRQKIKNILGETEGNAKLEYVLQTVRDGFTTVAEASNKANAIIDEIGLDPSTVDDLKDLIDEVIKLEDVQSSALKQERTLLTRLNSLKREANKEQKSGVAGVVKMRMDDVALMKAEEEMLEELNVDLNNQKETVNKLDTERSEYFDNWLDGIIDTTIANSSTTDLELENIKKVKVARQQAQQAAVIGLQNTLDFTQSLAQFQQAAMNRELAMAGENAEKRAEIEEKFAKRSQKIAIAQAAIRGALAIQKIAADVPKGDFGISTAILIGLQAANTAAQIAVIKSQQFKEGGVLEEFANGGIAQTGGMLRGPSHANGGIPFKVGGRVGFEAEGGEAIINKKSTALFKPILSAINQAGGGKKFETGGVTSFVPSMSGIMNKQLESEQLKAIEMAMMQQKTVLQIPVTTAMQNGINTVEVNSTL